MNEAKKIEDAVPRTWVAKTSTFMKASHLHARDLPETDKQAVAEGATLVARQIGRRHEFFLVADGFIDGAAVDPRLKFAHGGHWTEVAENLPAAGADAKPVSETPRVDPRKVKRRSRKKV